MTNFDHTDCSHDRTPAARRRCRANRVVEIRKLQAEFMAAAENNDSELIREYEAGVDNFAYRWNMTMADAFTLIEEGPVL